MIRVHPGVTLVNVRKNVFTDASTGLEFKPGVPVTIPADIHKGDDLRVGDHLEGLAVAVSAGILHPVDQGE